MSSQPTEPASPESEKAPPGVPVGHRRVMPTIGEVSQVLRSFVEHTPAALAMIDTNLRYVLVSRRWLADFSPEEKRLTGGSFCETFPDLPHAWKVVFDRCLAGTTETIEAKLTLQKTGKPAWIRCEAKPWYTANGAIGGLMLHQQIVTREIVERQQAELALQESEERFQRLSEASFEAIVITESGVVVEANKNFARMMGYEAHEVIGMPATQFMVWEDQDLMHQRQHQGEEDCYEANFICKDGSTFMGEIRGRSFSYQGRRLKVHAIHDITDRKWAEATQRVKEELQKLEAGQNTDLKRMVDQLYELSERRRAEDALARTLREQESIMAAIPDVFYVIDLWVRMLKWNRQLEAVTGLTASQVKGRSALAFFAEDDREKVIQAVYRAFSIGSMEVEARLISRSGELLDYHWNGVILKDEQGNVIGLTGIGRNITDRKKAEAALETKTQELQQALSNLQRTQSQLVQTEKMSSLGQLVAGIAHEINNPVNFIYGNLSYASQYAHDLLSLIQLYQDNYPQPELEIQKRIQEIDLSFIQDDLPKLFVSMEVGADRIRKLVLSLRSFSRMDESDIKAVDIHEGLESTLMILQNRLKAKSDSEGIQVIKDYGDLPKVECYPGQLNQVFMNILANAIDALESHAEENQPCEPPDDEPRLGCQPPTIHIRTSLKADGKYVAIQISDNGPGMTERAKARLFDPFFTTKPIGKGTGLGLAISYQIVVEKHGGTLDCWSEPGKGAEFLVEIPVQQSEQSLQDAAIEP